MKCFTGNIFFGLSLWSISLFTGSNSIERSPTQLINFIRPTDSPILRDKIFNSHKNHLMDFKSTGINYLKKMLKGYISHVRGADPLTYAKRFDKGVRPKGLKFTKVIKCEMMDFQKKIYNIAVLQSDDALDRKTESVANFVFPGFSQDRKSIVGYYGRSGLNLIKNQIKTSGNELNKKIGEQLFGEKNSIDIISISEDNKTITGRILQMPYLKYFSTKFYKSLKKISRLVYGKKGAKTAFIYSNLVKVGIELYQEILLQNGYLEYQEESSNYQINNNTVCYYCGKTFKEHKFTTFSDSLSGGEIINNNIDSIDSINSDNTNVLSEEYNATSSTFTHTVNLSEMDKSDSSTDYDKKSKQTNTVPSHKFYPATFISVTGKSTDDNLDVIPEDKKRILDNVFNNYNNKEGKYIKFILGSKVMNEGISLMNVGEVHVLDVYFNLGKVDQVVGRAIRNCSHYKLMSEENPFPTVNVYKYVVTVDKGLSSEEELYRKAEDKYLLIKKVERVMKEVAIDCPLNLNGNIFAEEVEEHKNCKPFSGDDKMCPGVCDYTKCEYKCDDIVLNRKYYDPNRKIYKKIDKLNLDYSTFTNELARNEIDYSKGKIKDMYLLNHMYKLNDILEHIKNLYSADKKDLFDSFFVYKALDELIPITNNDFNNFKDTIIDKYYNTGYLIYRDEYYIFQPFDQNEDVPIYYRANYNKEIKHKLSLYDYLKNSLEYNQLDDSKNSMKSKTKGLLKDDINMYDFESTMEYYDSRDEYEYVGIIDKELSRRKSKRFEEMKDVFKIREKRNKILEKKRGTGIPSFKGAVCSTAKHKDYLNKITKKLKIKINNNSTRVQICNKIRDTMLELEKYGTQKDKNKFTYVMIPINHSEYPFPYNLEDRAKDIVEKIKKEIKIKLNVKTTMKKKKDKHYYVINIKSSKSLKEYKTILDKYNANIKNKDTTITVE